MNKKDITVRPTVGQGITLRTALKQTSGVVAAVAATSLVGVFPGAHASPLTKESNMKHRAYVYTELQISAPFDNVPWRKVNAAIKEQPGFINKTWLSGAGNHSAGGIYTFDSIENAQKFVTNYFPKEAANLNAAFYTRVFDADPTEEASRAMASPFYR